MRQIKDAELPGYEETEIVGAVIHAMVPSLTLQNVLEAAADLTLGQSTKYLEAHFGEQNVTDLYNSLTSMIQLPGVSPYTFIMRCIEARQKLKLASDEVDIKYDKNFTQKSFFSCCRKRHSERIY